MEQTSINRLNTLHPKIREIALKAYKEAVAKTPAGVHPFIDEGLRSFTRSTALYNQPHDHLDNDGDGRIDEADEKVTNAPGGSSLHNYGLAFDFHLQVNGKDVWPDNFRADKNWMLVVGIFKAHGFKWGGDFKSITDAPHFEMSLGHTWRDLLALHNAGKVDKNGYVLI